MAVTSRELRVTRSPRNSAMTGMFGTVAYVMTFVLAALAIYVLVGTAVDWAKVRIDDMRYGRPRTTHVEGFLGRPGEVPGRPTRLIGMNLDRQVVVLELPAGDSTQIRSYPGPYLFGADEDLTPVLLSLRDMDRDDLPDLIVQVRNEQIVYLNRDGTFRLPTAEEQYLLGQEPKP